jgi:hypothetical protein
MSFQILPFPTHEHGCVDCEQTGLVTLGYSGQVVLCECLASEQPQCPRCEAPIVPDACDEDGRTMDYYCGRCDFRLYH